MDITYQRSLTVESEPEVLVCGTGCAGVTAAIAAARTGARTTAIERWPFAGGNITAASVPGCCGLADMTTGELAVGGIGLELLGQTGGIELPLSSTKLFEPILDEDALATRQRKLPYSWDVERFKIVADRTLRDCGVDFRYHARVVDVITAGKTIEAVVVADKGGLRAYRPRVVVDCTGDADVAAWAGVPCEIDSLLQPMTLEFHITGVEGTADKQRTQDRCAAVLLEARQAGRMGVYGGPWLSYPWPGVVRVNSIRLALNAALPEDRTRAEVDARADAWRMYTLWKEQLPEFQDAAFMFSGPETGARESRRIRGLYTLTKEDVVATRVFDDSIAKGAWYLDRHPPDTPGAHKHFFVKAYGIPYRTLLPQSITNLLVAGRCHSATSEALASSRVGMTAMAMGHAAGVAAALAAKGSISPPEVDTGLLRSRLEEQGAVL